MSNKQNNKKTITKALIATTVLASTVAPYAVEASTTLDTAAKIDAARATLNPALLDGYVTAVEELSAAVLALSPSEKTRFTTAMNTRLNYHVKAAEVVDSIQKILADEATNKYTVSEDKVALNSFKGDITNAKAAYLALGSTSRSYVKNYTALTTLETAITKQITYVQNLSKLTEFNNTMSKLNLDTLPNLADVKTAEAYLDLGDADKFTGQQLLDIQAARTEYNLLTSTLKNLVVDKFNTLKQYEAQATYQNNLIKLVNASKVTEFTNKVTTLDTKAADYPAQVAALQQQLTDDATFAAQVSAATKTRLNYHNQAVAVVEKINALAPSIIDTATQADLDIIKGAAIAARSSYSALGSTSRSFVANVADLTAVETAITARQNYLNNSTALTDWTSAITALKSVTLIALDGVTAADYTAAKGYTPDQKSYISEARKQYDLLTAALKKLVPAADAQLIADHEAQLELQVALEDAIAELQESQGEIDAEKLKWTNAYKALVDLGAVLEITSATTVEQFETEDFAKYLDDAKTAISTARSVYDTLSAEAKAQLAITAPQYKLLTDHENAVAQQKRLENAVAAKEQQANQTVANDFKNAVDALSTISDAGDYKTALDDLVYDDLPDAVKPLVSAATKLAYDNHKAAEQVITAIAALPAKAAIEATDIDTQAELDAVITSSDLNEIKADYDALPTSAIKALVFNYQNLLDLINAVATKQAAIDLKEHIAPFNTQMALLADVDLDAAKALANVEWGVALTETQVTVYDTIQAAAVTAADSAYNALSAEGKAAVATDYENLKNHQTYLGYQTNLLAEIAAYELVKTNVVAFADAVEALGEPLDFEGITTLVVAEGADPVAVYTPEQKMAINDLFLTYDDLADAQKYAVAAKATLDLHKAALEAQQKLESSDQATKVEALKVKIDGWNVTSSNDFADFSAEVTAANAEYTALSPEDKLLISTTTKKKLDNYLEAFEIIDQIEALKSEDNQAYEDKTVSGDLDVFLNTGNAIKAEYVAALSPIKTIVSAANYAALTAYIDAVTAKKNGLLIEETLADWVTKFNVVKSYSTTMFDLAEGVKFDYNNFPTFETTEKPAIEVAKAAYDVIDGLTDKMFVNAISQPDKDLLQDLLDLIDTYEDLKQAQLDAEVAEEAAIRPFLNAWDALKGLTVIAYTDTDTVENFEDKGSYDSTVKQSITDAEGLYENMDQNYVLNQDVQDAYADLLVLKASVDKYLGFVTEKNNAAAITDGMKSWTELVDGLLAIALKGYDSTSINAINVDTGIFVDHDEAARGAVVDALEAYGNLGMVGELDLKTKVDGTAAKIRLDALAAEIKAYDDAKVAKELANKDAAVSAVVTAINELDAQAEDFLTKLSATELLHMNLSEIAKAEFNTTKTTEKEKLANMQAIAPVVRAFNQLATIDTVNAATTVGEIDIIAAAVSTVRGSYDLLSNTQKTLYKDTTLLALEDAIKVKKLALQKAAAIKSWTDGYALLPALKDFTNITAETLNTVALYSTGDISTVKGLETTYNGYSSETKLLINPDEYEQFTKVLAAVNKQEELQAEASILPALNAWKDAFGELPEAAISFKDVTVDNFEDAQSYAPETIVLIEAARTELGKLTTEQLKYVKAEHVALLEAHESAVTEQARLQALFDAKEEADTEAQKLADFVEGLTALNPSSETYVESYEEVEEKYALLGETLQAKVTAAQKVSYGYHGRAVAVVDAIVKAIDPAKLEAATTVESITIVENELKAVQTAYSTLGSTSRSYVKNYAKLAPALTAAAEKKATIQQAAVIKDWTEQFPNLPGLLNFDNVTYETIGDAITYAELEIDEVEALRAIYNGYDATVKGYIKKVEYDQLVALETAIERQQLLINQAATAGEQLTKLAAWEVAYEALPNYVAVDDLTIENFAEIAAYEVDVTVLITAARTEYNKLDADAKAFVTPTELNEITKLETAFNKYTSIKTQVNAAQATEAAEPVIEAIGTISLENIADAITLMEQYEELSDEAKAKIPTAQVVKLRYYSGAAKTIELIDALSSEADIKAITDETAIKTVQTNVQAARASYSALGSTSRSYVTNLSVLTAVEAAVAAQVKVIENNKLLITWTDAVGDLSDITVFDFTEVTVENFEVKYDGDTQAVITKVRAEYNNLASTLKSYVATTVEYKKLVDLEAAVKAQATLEGQKAAVDATAYAAKVTAMTGNEEGFVEAVAGLQTEFDALSVTTQSKVSAATKTLLSYLKQAAAVVDEINALTLDGDSEEAIAAFKLAVTTARANYAKLGSTSRSFVKNSNVLVEREATANGL